MTSKPIICSHLNHFTNHKNRADRAVAFGCRPLPSIHKYRNHRRDLQTICKISFFQTQIKSSSCMYQSSSSHFFRTTSGLQSGPDALDESRLAMTLFINLQVKVILCIFRLVLKWRAGDKRLILLYQMQ